MIVYDARKKRSDWLRQMYWKGFYHAFLQSDVLWLFCLKLQTIINYLKWTESWRHATYRNLSYLVRHSRLSHSTIANSATHICVHVLQNLSPVMNLTINLLFHMSRLPVCCTTLTLAKKQLSFFLQLDRCKKSIYLTRASARNTVTNHYSCESSYGHFIFNSLFHGKIEKIRCFIKWVSLYY